MRYGALNASDDGLRETLRWTRALDFVEALPNGTMARSETMRRRFRTGSINGSRSPAPSLGGLFILIPDEATSALSSENEHAVHDAVDASRKMEL